MREYAADWGALQATDPEVAAAVAGELARERSTLRLIASENFASPAVLAAVGSTLNNKYAEGYPGRRYYGGCEYVDIVEQLAIDRAKQLFGAEHANVQSARRCHREHGGVRRVPRAEGSGEQGARDGAGPRGPSDPRLAGERVGHVVQLRGLRGRSRDRAARYGPRPRPGQGASVPRSSWPATPRTHGRSTSRRSARSPTRSAPCCGSTPRTSSGLLPAARSPHRSRTPTSSPLRRTRPFGGRAVP